MPPKAIVSKEDVLQASLVLIKEEGKESLNARNLATRLHCSTNPLFRLYKNMEDLKKDVYREAEKCYERYLTSKTFENTSPILQMGLAYIYFAKEEKQLFDFIFLSNNIEITSFHSIADMADSPELIAIIGENTGLNEYLSKELFSNLWLLTHGIACSIARNQYPFNELEIRTILTNLYKGLVYVLTEDERNTCINSSKEI